MKTFSLTRPAEPELRRFVDEQRDLKLTYPEIGASENPTALAAVRDRYTLDRDRVQVGTGRNGFEQAKAALQRWEMFNLDFVELLWPNAPIERDTNVAVLARSLGLWVLNTARIVYLVDREAGGVREYGFAYGTLPSHAFRGEERFAVEWRAEDDSVWYDRQAFSRPQHPFVALGWPYMRHVQKRFSADSIRAMRSACA